MKVELIRHGETALQRERRYQGRTEVPLLAEEWTALQRDARPLKRVYVSPLLRARETAAILFPLAEAVPISGLEEMDFGAFEGKNYLELENDAAYRAWVDGGCLGRCPGGESKEEFCGRVCAAFSQLMDEAVRRGEEEVVIVAHGGTMMAALERYGRPERDYFSWNRPCGAGILLDARLWRTERTLRFLAETWYRGGSG